MSKTNKNSYFFTWENSEGEKMQSPFFSNRSDANSEKQIVESVFNGKITSKTLVKPNEETK